MKVAVSHSSPYSGTWYPADPNELREMLDGFFEKSRQRTGGYLAPEPVGFVVPHAGLVYSGTVAAAAYRHLEASGTRRVVVLGFTHSGSGPGAWIPEVEAYRTPLGEILVDRQAIDELAAGGVFGRCPEAEVCDHSVEIQLPLLQRAAPQAALVPVYTGHLDEAARATVAKRLATLAGPGTVFVASSDFTHYGRSFAFRPFPVDGMIAERLRELDESAMEAAGSLNAELFLRSLANSGATVCGYEPISLLLETVASLPGDEVFQCLLDYQTSGEITGDYNHSVSYTALGYFRHRAFTLNAEEQALLLASARNTLAAYQATGERKPVAPARVTPGLEQRAGAFVTLHQNGELRGCVGRGGTDEPLWKTVPEMALAAALDDSRFPSVGRHEAGIEVEISVLSPFKRLVDPRSLRAGEHGAVLEAGVHRGLLLPQVASERGWNAEQFLEALARKTGVGAEVYGRKDTRVFAFRAQVMT